ncbi:hypothetical protein TNCV_3006601 [Trichonephila clavipes]|nr:hypothetical protein TNCV_3006601 [Trichonephila clavipes]
MKTRLQKTGENLQDKCERSNLFAVFRGRPEGWGNPEGCKNADVQDLKSALLYALKLDAAKEASCRDHHSIRWIRVIADAPSESPWIKEIEKLGEKIQDFMAQRQNLRRRIITCWECGGAGHLRSSCPRINKEDRNIKCWGVVETGIASTGTTCEVTCKVCRTYDPCVARKDPWKRTRGRLQLYNVGVPFERIAFDILGLLPRSPDGNNHILVGMDYFTKWPEAYPIPEQEASTVAEVLVQHWISRFGVPLQLHSDQGRNFDSAVCKRLCEILAIDKIRTTALYPQSDGMVERFNRTILNSLSLLVSSNQQDWGRKLPFCLLAYRSSFHETTGYSPSQMLFGHNVWNFRFSVQPANICTLGA